MSDRPLLLTPGPLTTADAVRAAAGLDHGSRDPLFVAQSDEVRARLAGLVGDPAEWAAVPLQGSGTFAVEAALGTLVGPSDHLLVVINGAYGKRMVQIMERIGRTVSSVAFPEETPVDPAAIDAALAANPSISHVAVVHCETTTGVLNPLAEVADVVGRHGRRLIVDAMSAFGAVALPDDLSTFDAVLASSNKCLEGIPGIGFVIARRAALMDAQGNSPSLALDLYDQLVRFDKDGQWRFTPPVQVLSALHAAIIAHAAEGGVAGRGARYRENLSVLVGGLRALGFETLLPDAVQAPIIVTFLAPEDPAWDFGAFYDALRDRGFAIYPGKLTERDTFRVGCIGQVFPEDLRRFVEAVRAVVVALGLTTLAPAA